MKTYYSNRNRIRRHRNERGAAVVEAALCIPLIVLLMFGTLEICAGFFLQQSLTIAAYEGARTGVKRQETRDSVVDMVERILVARNVDISDGVTIDVQPQNLDTLAALEPVRVTVTVPTRGNTAFIFDSLADRDLTATVSMAREFDN